MFYHYFPAHLRRYLEGGIILPRLYIHIYIYIQAAIGSYNNCNVNK